MREASFPEGWELVKVKELCELSHGRAISPKEVISRRGLYPVYGASTKGGGIAGYLNTYDHKGERIVWVKYGPHAGTASFTEGEFNCTYLLGALKIKGEKKDRVDARYLRHAIGYQTPKYTTSTSIPRLTNTMIMEIPINLPPLHEQRKIAKLLDSVEEGVVATEKAIGMTVTVRDALSYRAQAARVTDFKLSSNERRKFERLHASFDEHIEVNRKRRDYLLRLGKSLAGELLAGKRRFYNIP